MQPSSKPTSLPAYAQLITKKAIAIFLVLSLFLQFASPLAAYGQSEGQIDTPPPPYPLTPAEGTVITVIDETPGAPTDPQELVDPPLAMPEFSWTEVNGTTNYQLQFSKDIAFTVKFEIKTPLTHYTPVDLNTLMDGEWYWRVRVESPVPSEYSNPVMFFRSWASPSNRPGLIKPANGLVLDSYDTNAFEWTPVVGAASYLLQIAPSIPELDDPANKKNYKTITTRYQPLERFVNGTYYWRVTPLDPKDRRGTASEIYVFTQAYGSSTYAPHEVPVLIVPENFSTVTFTPTFRWTAVRGAAFYRLQYTTHPNCDFNQAGFTETKDVFNTIYTPTAAVQNDTNYCWHVRAVVDNKSWEDAFGDWSPTWRFSKLWYIQAIPLTPTNGFQYVKHPFFSWTPVPGAATYKIEVSKENSFKPPIGGFTAFTVNPWYVREDFNWSVDLSWFWRVTPFDGNGKEGQPSDESPIPVSAMFAPDITYLVPHQYYPQYYYPPSSYPPPNEDVVLSPHEDRTIGIPVFMWHRPFDMAGAEATTYRIEVDDSYQFDSVNWRFDTEHLSAVPTMDNNFSPLPNTDYYWRVCVLDTLGGACSNPWSQIWRTRIDSSKMFAAKETITLLRPLNGSESIETTPLFEWFPVAGANSYQVQISQDPTFSTVTDDQAVSYPTYAPRISLAQRSLNRLAFGTYYWRVKGLYNGVDVGTWSAPWRFTVSSQTQWRVTRTLGNAENRLEISSDPDDVPEADYELTQQYFAQDRENWYFGFNFSGTGNATYALYLDFDRKLNYGATSDARGYSITTIPEHRPEFIIYLFKNAGTFDASQVFIHRWAGNGWDPTFKNLGSVGGSLMVDGDYVEIQVPVSQISAGGQTSSASISLVSADAGTLSIKDTTPASTNLTVLDRFTSVSERMNLGTPPSNATGDTTTFSSVPAFFFNYPSNTPWEGFNIMVSLDPNFNTWIRDFTWAPNAPYTAPPMYDEQVKVQDLDGDNTYFWRVRPQYFASTNIAGAWSEAIRFNREGFVPQNLKTSVSFGTPVFSWDMVEGADEYNVMVSREIGFGTWEFSVNTNQNVYIPFDKTLGNGTYYWRVRVIRDSTYANDWSETQTFVQNLPAPVGLNPNTPNPNPSQVFPYAPTLCWNPLIVNDDDGIPTLAAYAYNVQVSMDPNFSSPFVVNIDTQQTCYTPTIGLQDGTYYWRVAMIDGKGKIGLYSPSATFKKQYPTSTLLYPVNISSSDTPTFYWTPVHGAAYYLLEISQYETFAPIFESITTNATRYTPTKIYPPGKIYYWRVAIKDKDNKIGPFTDAKIILGLNAVFLPLVKRP